LIYLGIFYLTLVSFLAIYYGILFEITSEKVSIAFWLGLLFSIVFIFISYFVPVNTLGLIVVGLGGGIAVAGIIVPPLLTVPGILGLLLVVFGSFLSLPKALSLIAISPGELILTRLLPAEVELLISEFLAPFSGEPPESWAYIFHPLFGSFLFITTCIVLSILFFKKDEQKVPGGSFELIGQTGVARSNLEPEGKIEMGDEIWIARAKSGIISPNTEVEVIGEENEIPIVKKKNNVTNQGVD